MGNCLSLCASENLTPCKCTEQQNACKVCCVISGRCQPHKDNVTGATLDLPNGRTCQTEEFQQGTCDNVRKRTFQAFCLCAFSSILSWGLSSFGK